MEISDGSYYVNMDITEVEDGYECVFVRIDGFPTYPAVVEKLIRERYSQSDELAIQRQRDSKPSDFAEYDSFCEMCKLLAKQVFAS